MIDLVGIHAKFSGMEVLRDINIKFRKCSFTSIIGPNGCGKTTLLNIISGLNTEYDGNIISTEKLQISYIFQNPNDALLPWKNVKENILLGQKIQINDILKKTNLDKFSDYYPYQLSGGMKQLVCLARAIAHRSNVILFDEPFSSLDYSMKAVVKEVIKKSMRDKTCIFISHDLNDTFDLSDEIILLTSKPTTVQKIFSKPEFHKISDYL